MMATEEPTIFTIGHSNHELSAFIALLMRHGVTLIADVRSRPFSRISHFNREQLATALKAHGIKYVPLGRELGARRDEQECYVDGRAVYERVAALPLFQEGIDRLVRGARDQTIALMCAEKEPLDCHRFVLICRHLRGNGVRIRHILADGQIEEQADAERRLVSMTGVSADLFSQNVSDQDLVEQAYEARGRQIAYRSEREGAME